VYDPLGRYETVPLETDGSGGLRDLLLRYGIAAQIGVDMIVRGDPGGIQREQAEPFRNVIAIIPHLCFCLECCNMIYGERGDEDMLADALDWSALDDPRVMLFEDLVRYSRFSNRRNCV
jgi:hypothetical protein